MEYLPWASVVAIGTSATRAALRAAEKWGGGGTGTGAEMGSKNPTVAPAIGEPSRVSTTPLTWTSARGLVAMSEQEGAIPSNNASAKNDSRKRWVMARWG